MKLTSRTALVSAAVAVFLFGGSVAATGYTQSAESGALSDTTADGAARGGARSFDDRLALLAEDVPDFGGFYLDEEASRLYVFTTDASHETARDIRGRIAVQLDRPEIRDFTATPLKGTYSWAQLWEWRRSARPVVLDEPGVVSCIG